MKTIRLIREVSAPAACGPTNGMFALQKALREYGPNWLAVGGDLQDGEIPWFWCWLDAWKACRYAARGMPFVCGPNIFFHSGNHPCGQPYEAILCEANSCRMVFTESEWYRDLIAAHLTNGAPIVLWPYPIADPFADAPLLGNAYSPPIDYDALIYAKSGIDLPTLGNFGRRWPNNRLFLYGHYRREDLIDAAQRSRVCLYLSASDRGPLALAEILLCGCPAIGCRTGAPWIADGVNGFYVRDLSVETVTDAAKRCLGAGLDRAGIRAAALERFDPRRIVATIVDALATIRTP